MWYFIIIGILIIVIAGVYVDARNEGDYVDEEEGDEKEDIKLPYQKKDYLFSIAEKKFYDVLMAVVKDDYLIFAKVRVVDLLYISKKQKNRRSDLNKIISKHVDFVLCDKFKVCPLIAIELDDSTHKRDNRKQRDEFIDEAFNVAGLPILHIKNSYQYNQQDLAQQIQQCIKQKTP